MSRNIIPTCTDEDKARNSTPSNNNNSIEIIENNSNSDRGTNGDCNNGRSNSLSSSSSPISAASAHSPLVSSHTNAAVFPMKQPLSLAPFDGIRGLCAVVIVLGHILSFFVPVVPREAFSTSPSSSSPSSPTAWPAFGLDYFSVVSLFMVLSGFTLVHVYEQTTCGNHLDTNANPQTQPPLSSWPELKAFFQKRVARLAPVYYFVLVLNLPCLIISLQGYTLVVSIVSTLLWVQTFTVLGNFWVQPLWTVSALAVCYLLFPPLLKRLRSMASVSLCLLCLMCYLFCVLIMVVVLIVAGFELAVAVHVFIAFRLPQFIVGMSACLLARRLSDQSVVVSHATLIAELCSLTLLLNIALCATLTAVLSGDFYQYYYYITDAAILPIQALWLVALSMPSCSCLSRWLLSTKPMVLLGHISYSLYCIHWPVLIWASFFKTGYFAPFGRFLYFHVGWFAFPAWTTPLLLFICLIFAILTYTFIEKPSRHFIGGHVRVKGGGHAGVVKEESDARKLFDPCAMHMDTVSTNECVAPMGRASGTVLSESDAVPSVSEMKSD